MSFPWILQRYIFRETGKTFLLTAIALTGVLGLGGGVREMIQLGEVTPGQLIRLLALVLPVAAALTLPIAALFSATVTYGRLSADNEFVACRASGINLYLLFLPTLVIGLLSTFVTFAFINFVIPGMVRNLNEFIGGDVGVLIKQRLSSPKGIPLGGKFRVYADSASADPQSGNRIFLNHVAFVELEGEEWVRYGTARQVELNFERQPAKIRAQGAMLGLSFFDRRGGRFTDLEQQSIPATDLPLLLAPQIKFLTLSELLHFARNPVLWNDVAAALARLRLELLRRLVYDAALNDFETAGFIALADSAIVYELRPKKIALLTRDGGVELNEVSIARESTEGSNTWVADRAVIEVVRGDELEQSAIRIEAYDLKTKGNPAIQSRPKHLFAPIMVPKPLVDRVLSLTEEQLLASSPPTEASSETVTERRLAAVQTRDTTIRKIWATIHERIAFSVSVLALVVLGAALGIIFRGSHVLTAFGISFGPSLAVIVSIVTGRQLAINAPTHVTGLLVIWAGIIVVCLLNIWILTRVLRR